MKTKKHIMILIAIILVASFLRLYNLGSTDLDNDEAKTALGVDFPHSFVLPGVSVASQEIFGHSEFAARLPFALFGILSVILFYFLGKELINKNIGLAFAALTAILPINVLVSRSAFLDISLVADWLLILLFWIKYEKVKSSSNFFWLLIGLAIAPWLKIQGIYLLAALFIYILIIRKGVFWRDERFYLITVSFIPFFFYFLSQPQQLYDMYSYVSKQIDATSQIKEFASIIFYGYGLSFIIALAGLIISLKETKKDKLDQNWRNNLILMSVITIFLLVELSIMPKKFFYFVMFDITIVFYCVFIWMQLKNVWAKYFLVILIILNSAYLLLATNQFSITPLIGRLGTDRYAWHENASLINKEISNSTQPVLIYSDDQLGFGAKWYINNRLYKMDYLLNHFEVARNVNSIVLVNGNKKEIDYKLQQNNFKALNFDQIKFYKNFSD